MRVEGIPASPGYAEGQLFDLDQPPASYKVKASAAPLPRGSAQVTYQQGAAKLCAGARNTVNHRS